MVDEFLSYFRRCRIAGPQPAVNFKQRFFLALHLVQGKGFANGIADGHAVDEKQIEFRNPAGS